MSRKLPEFDQGLAMLLQDLQDRNMLDDTIVTCTGEFGRTPRVQWNQPWNGGRSHYGKCFSSLVAGGGFVGGKVVGESDATGSNVVSRPVLPQDFTGSVYQLLGIDPDGIMPNPRGLKVPILPKASAKGRLDEIMKA
jgi:arylsulfatase A-like enzyme